MSTAVDCERYVGVMAKWAVWPTSILLFGLLIALAMLVVTGRHEGRYLIGIILLGAIIIYFVWSIFTSPNSLRSDREFVYLYRGDRKIVIPKSDMVAVEAMFSYVSFYYLKDDRLRFDTANTPQWRILSAKSLESIRGNARYSAINYLGWPSKERVKVVAEYDR